MQFNFGNLSGIGGLGTGIAAGINAQTDQRLKEEEKAREAASKKVLAELKIKADQNKAIDKEAIDLGLNPTNLGSYENKVMAVTDYKQKKKVFDISADLTESAAKDSADVFTQKLNNYYDSGDLSDIQVQQLHDKLDPISQARPPEWAKDGTLYKRILLKRTNGNMPVDEVSMIDAYNKMESKNRKETSGYFPGEFDVPNKAQLKRFEEADASQKQHSNLLETAERLDRTLFVRDENGIIDKKAYVGKLANVHSGAVALFRALGVPMNQASIERLTNTQTADKEFNKLILDNASKLTGALSDKDLDFLKKSGAKITDEPETLAIFIKGLKNKANSVKHLNRYGKIAINNDNEKGFSNTYVKLLSEYDDLPAVMFDGAREVETFSNYRDKSIKMYEETTNKYFDDLSDINKMKFEISLAKQWKRDLKKRGR